MDMKNMIFCQSCAMPMMKDEDFGTNADKSKNNDYCSFCYKDGSFTSNVTMDEMIENCVPFVSKGNPYSSEDEARRQMKEMFPALKRWQQA